MIYAFEELDETLDLLPLSARRALDRAGCKLSLSTWRTISVDVRRSMVAAGAVANVDGEHVRHLLAEAKAPFDPITPVDDPGADRVPEPLASTLGSLVGDDTWRVLGPLDRYALAKLSQKYGPSDKVLRALSEIVIVAEPRLNHLTHRGEAHMVDVGEKPESLRRARASARVRMQEATAMRLRSGTTPKGDVLAVARIAGIHAAKRTPDLIPLCHVVRITQVRIDLTVEPQAVAIEATVEAVDRTGVEMEALTAATTSALTVYDMLKGIDRAMTIEVALTEKTGGRSGTWTRDDAVKAAR